MPLKADQRAMLQLLLERGQSYDDIASVLGVGRDEVRQRARAALTELAGSDPDAEVDLTDYLLGQADPIGRADAVRHLQNDPDALQLASDLEAQLQLLAPEAQLPELPAPRGRRRGAKRPTPVPAGPGPTPATPGDEAAPAGEPLTERLRGTLSSRQQQVIVGLAAGAVILVAALLAITGAFGGDEESGGTETTAEDEALAGEDTVAVPLEAQGGGDATGEALFGLATEDQLFVDVSVEGLEPAPAEDTYVVWLLLTPDRGYPVSPIEIDENGDFSDRFPISPFAIPIAARAQFVDVALTNRDALGAQLGDFADELRKAGEAQLPILRYEGESVLRGEIPAAGGPALEEGGEGGGGGAGGGGG
jgi:hypothetical protein